MVCYKTCKKQEIKKDERRRLLIFVSTAEENLSFACSPMLLLYIIALNKSTVFTQFFENSAGIASRMPFGFFAPNEHFLVARETKNAAPFGLA